MPHKLNKGVTMSLAKGLGLAGLAFAAVAGVGAAFITGELAVFSIIASANELSPMLKVPALMAAITAPVALLTGGCYLAIRKHKGLG